MFRMIIDIMHQSWLLLVFDLISNFNSYPTWLTMLHLRFFQKISNHNEGDFQKDTKNNFEPSKISVLKREKLCKNVQNVHFFAFILKIILFFFFFFFCHSFLLCALLLGCLCGQTLFFHILTSNLWQLPQGFFCKEEQRRWGDSCHGT